MRKLTIVITLLLSMSSFGQNSESVTKFTEADSNGDGVIQVNEVTRVIDGFFIGTHDRGVMYVHSLIDYFFEQP